MHRGARFGPAGCAGCLTRATPIAYNASVDTRTSFIAKVLGEYSLPYIEPFLLLSCGQLARVFETAGEHFSQTSAQDLHH